MFKYWHSLLLIRQNLPTIKGCLAINYVMKNTKMRHVTCDTCRGKKSPLQIFSSSYVHSVYRSFCPHFPKSNVQTFWYSKFLGKSNRKKWLQMWTFLLKNYVNIQFFLFLEFLGKSDGKKVVSDCKTFPHKGSKIIAKKSFFLANCVLKEFIFILFSCHLSPVTCHQSSVTCHLSPVICHLSPVTCHLSPVISYPSPVNCHLPPAIGDLSSDHNWRPRYLE